MHAAIDTHRAAHDELTAALASDPEGVADPNLKSRTMPAHPGDSAGGVAEKAATVRDSMAECRRVLKQAEQVFATSRSRAADASSAVQIAVTAARREKSQNNRGKERPAFS